MSDSSSQTAGQDNGGEESPEIAWVGEQYRMAGYCGRATTPPPPPPPPPAEPAPTDAELRPVAVVRRAKRWQGRVVRIGPPRQQPQSREAA